MSAAVAISATVSLACAASASASPAASGSSARAVSGVKIPVRSGAAAAAKPNMLERCMKLRRFTNCSLMRWNSSARILKSMDASLW